MFGRMPGYCVSKDDGDLLGAQLRESGSFIPVMMTRELSLEQW